MRRVLGALLVAAALPACFSGSGRCERASRAQVSAALLAESARPVSLRWDDVSERPTLLSGDFALSGATEEAAVLGFLAINQQRFGLSIEASSLSFASRRVGRAGAYLRFAQRYQGLPVFRGEVIAQVGQGEGGLRLRSLRLAQRLVSGALSVTPTLSAAEATAKALEGRGVGVSAQTTLGVWAEGAPRLVYQINLSQERPLLAQELFLDAHTGEALAERSLLQSDEGVGLIFDPNPIASTGDLSLKDQQDETSQFLSDARLSVPLPGLDGSGFLRGRFVDVRNATSRTQNQALVFNFQRSDERFEEVMAYFHMDRVQARIQSLGFFDVNNRVQVATVNAFSEDNSFYSPLSKRISYGAGGVDDAEDADIIVHEYGHSIQDDQVPGFGVNTESRSMGEGFSDYLAGSFMATMSSELTDPACVGDWDATSYDFRVPACLRRLDLPKHFPEHLVGEVHADGELWSAALFELRQALGANTADALALEAHFSQSVDETFAGAASTILAADDALFGGQHKALIKRVFQERGILRDLTPPADLPVVVASVAVSVEPAREGGAYFDANTDLQTIKVLGAQGLRLRFSQLDTELNPSCFEGACDNLYLFDEAGNLFQILNGSSANVSSVVIPGDTVQLRLVSDFSQTAFGYRVDLVEVMGSAPGPTCDNGSLEATEQCDGDLLQNATCETLGFEGGDLSCNINCTFNASACEGESLCGNQQRDEGEDCDGADVGGQSCSDAGQGAGALSCNPDCTFNTDSCSQCGDGLLSGAEACDGLELSGASCETVGLTSGFLRCSGACTFDTSACLPPVCE
jgi:Fungalysin metallopeptidase (M36)